MKPMLAVDYDPDKQIWPCIAQPKIDGIRCIIKDGCALSRTLKPIPNYYVRSILDDERYNGFDGELVVGSFQSTTSGVMSVDGCPNFKFMVFDLWDQGEMPYQSRATELLERVRKRDREHEDHIKLCSMRTILNHKHLEQYEQEMLFKGYEGVILRNPDSPYKFGRSTTTEGELVRVKQFVDAEAKILGFEEQKRNDNEATVDNLGHTKRSSHAENKVGKNTLGKLHVVGINGRFEGVKFKVGTGFTDNQRKHIWTCPNQYMGKTIKYKYQDIGSKDKPRIPVFLGMRHEDDG